MIIDKTKDKDIMEAGKFYRKFHPIPSGMRYLVEVTDNNEEFYNRRINLETNDEIKNVLMEYKNAHKNASGCYILTSNEPLSFTILFINNECDYYNLFFHELTHIINFTRYKSLTKIECNEKILFEDVVFRTWDEYRATYVGITTFYNYMMSTKAQSIDECIEYIKRILLWLETELRNTKDINILYQLFWQFLGISNALLTNWEEHSIEIDILNRIEIKSLQIVLLNNLKVNNMIKNYDSILRCINNLYSSGILLRL